MGHRRTSHGYPWVKEGQVMDRSYRTVQGSSNRGLSDQILKMVNTLKIEDRLEGETNFQAWKERILLLLEENDLKEYVEVVVADPMDPQELVVHKKKEVKAKRVLLESVKDHLILHISEKKSAKEMYDALVSLYQNKNTGRLLHLKHQLQVVRMSSEDMVVNYLMNITQI
jgi:hypothetical protein